MTPDSVARFTWLLRATGMNSRRRDRSAKGCEKRVDVASPCGMGNPCRGRVKADVSLQPCIVRDADAGERPPSSSLDDLGSLESACIRKFSAVDAVCEDVSTATGLSDNSPAVVIRSFCMLSGSIQKSSRPYASRPVVLWAPQTRCAARCSRLIPRGPCNGRSVK